MTVWDTSYVNDLPDSAFLLVEPGGHKDAQGKTLPRTLRHFPVRNAAGDVDKAHVANALARIPQASTLSASQRETAMAKAKTLAKGTDVSGPPGEYAGSAGSGRSRSFARYDDELPAEVLGDQVRSFVYGIELRSDAAGRTLLGRAVPFGVTADVGSYQERFVQGAFARQIASGNIGRAKLFESHHARLEGAAPIGKTAQLVERSDGLHGAWPLNETTRANDALELVRSGEVTGLSVGFKAVPGGSVKGRDGVIERRAVHLDHVVLTHEPVYADAGVLSVRSAGRLGRRRGLTSQTSWRRCAPDPCASSARALGSRPSSRPHLRPPSRAAPAVRVDPTQENSFLCRVWRPGGWEPIIMGNRLLEKLGGDFETLTTQYETILNRCADEGRDPSESEVGLLDGLRSQMAPLGERIIELRQVDDARMAAVTAMTGVPELPGLEQRGGNRGDAHAVVHVRTEPEVYRRDASPEDRHGFFRDLFYSQMDGDVEARSRLTRHMEMRAAGTTGGAPGVVPPTWLFEEFAVIAHGARPWADTLRHVGITDANPVNIGVQQSPGAVIAAQAGENTPPSDGSFTATVLPTSPKAYTGKVDVSRQMLDGSNPAVDGLVFTDCMGAYNEQIESAVVTAIEGAASYAATITYPGTAPVYANLMDAFIDAGASVRKHRKAPPRVVFCSEGAWAYMGKEKDTAGRPLITTGYHGPMNAYGLGEAVTYGQIAGEVVGLNVVPSWAQATDNHIFVAKADDLLLLESSTFNFRYEEVLGPESIRLGVWGYAAPVVGRYAMAIAKIDGGVTIPAPQEAESNGNGNGGSSRSSSTGSGK